MTNSNPYPAQGGRYRLDENDRHVPAETETPITEAETVTEKPAVTGKTGRRASAPAADENTKQPGVREHVRTN